MHPCKDKTLHTTFLYRRAGFGGRGASRKSDFCGVRGPSAEFTTELHYVLLCKIHCHFRRIFRLSKEGEESESKGVAPASVLEPGPNLKFSSSNKTSMKKSELITPN